MNVEPTAYALLVLLGLAIALVITDWVLTPYRRFKIRRTLRCAIGDHDPGPIVRRGMKVGNLQINDASRRVRRCDWCDKVVAEYEVNGNEIRRID